MIYFINNFLKHLLTSLHRHVKRNKSKWLRTGVERKALFRLAAICTESPSIHSHPKLHVEFRMPKAVEKIFAVRNLKSEIET